MKKFALFALCMAALCACTKTETADLQTEEPATKVDPNQVLIHINFMWTGYEHGGVDIQIPEWDQYQITKIEFALWGIGMYDYNTESWTSCNYNVVQTAKTDYWPFGLTNGSYLYNSSIKITTKSNHTFAWQVNGIPTI